MRRDPVNVVFYFPWKEVSGGPIYLTRLADELAKYENYRVFYTDYQDGLSDDLLKNDKVQKIVVSESDFGIKLAEPVILVTPIYFASWLPELHPDSKLVFINWHMCCIPTLMNNWRITENNIDSFLKLVHDTSSVFFCDESHRLGQNTAQIEFAKDIVPISLPDKKEKALESLVSATEMNIAVLGRLCTDKIYSVINLLENIEALDFKDKVNVHIIGDGPDKQLLKAESYKKSNLIYVGTLSASELDIYLANKVDILFAMGTSVLEGGALSLPSVIIPHNMHPIDCNSYVYLQDSQGYCLGWYEDQFSELCLTPLPLLKIFKDIYKENNKKLYGELAHQYYVKNHRIDNAIKPLINILNKSSLTYHDFCEGTKFFVPTLKRINFAGHILLDLYKEKSGVIYLRLFNFLRIMSFHSMPDHHWKRMYILGIPLIELCRVNRKFHFRFLNQNRNQITLMRQQIASLEMRITTYQFRETDVERTSLSSIDDSGVTDDARQLDKQSLKHSGVACVGGEELRNQLNYQHDILISRLELLAVPQVQQMDTCDKILSAESYDYFCGDIKTDYIGLIANLDDESIRVVNRIIARIQQYREHNTSYFHFTQEESSALRQIEDQHASSVIKLNDEYFAYGKFIIPIKLITTTIFYYKYFIDQLHSREKIRNKSIIDVGGSFGDSALILSSETSSDVHVFEPTTEMYELARKTVAANKISNIILNKMALGDKEQSLVIRLDNDFSTFTFENDSDIATELVSVSTLDAYVDKLQLQVGLIKVDIEGFEKNFLKGAEKTIKSQRPVLILSIYHSAEDFFRIKEIIESYNVGYSFKIRKPADKSVIVDTMLIAEAN